MIEPVFAVLVGLFIAAAAYLMLSRALVRVLLGIVLLGNGVNLMIFVAGRLTRRPHPAVILGLVSRICRGSPLAGCRSRSTHGTKKRQR